jgi:hypothetical protein
MLNELDFIESDWSAIFWAIESVVALVRKSEAIGRAVGGVVLGASIALLQLGVALAVVIAAFTLFRGLAEQLPWYGWAIFAAAICGVFTLTAQRLWRKRRASAIGLLCASLTFGVPLAIHIVSHNLKG